jgi:hypothetical protein
MVQQARKMWQYPWRYKESITFVSGIVIVGFLLQITVGAFDFSRLKNPVNLILGISIILFLSVFSFSRKNRFYKWFSGVPFSVSLIGALLILGLIMGLTPQMAGHIHSSASVPSVLGFDRMTSSWSFILIYFLVLLSLGGLIVRKIFAFQVKDYAFYLNHIGLWLILFASGLGAADMEWYVMRVYEGEVEWCASNHKNEIIELPVAVELNDFNMEVYPPHLTVIDRNTGKAQPEDRPEFFTIDTKRPEGKLDGWNIRLEKYIHEAVRNSDSTYHEVRMPGSSPAAKITTFDRNTGEERSGWVCSGNMSQLYMVLNLDTNYCVAMMRPEPKRFVSDINVYRKGREVEHAFLEVNRPYRAGAWTIYQYSYDEEAGKLSNYSIMELVYDPWLIPVYIGIFMLAAGSVCMLWTGNRRKTESDAADKNEVSDKNQEESV